MQFEMRLIDSFLNYRLACVWTFAARQRGNLRA